MPIAKSANSSERGTRENVDRFPLLNEVCRAICMVVDDLCLVLGSHDFRLGFFSSLLFPSHRFFFSFFLFVVGENILHPLWMISPYFCYSVPGLDTTIQLNPPNPIPLPPLTIHLLLLNTLSAQHTQPITSSKFT